MYPSIDPVSGGLIRETKRRLPGLVVSVTRYRQGDVDSVGYVPSVTEFVTDYRCQECSWSETDR